MQTQITCRCVIEEEIEDLGEKPLRYPPSLFYLMHLSPISSYSNKASQNHVFSSSPDPVICSIASTKAWLLPILPNSTKTSLDTLKGCGKCLGYQHLNGMEMER